MAISPIPNRNDPWTFTHTSSSTGNHRSAYGLPRRAASSRAIVNAANNSIKTSGRTSSRARDATNAAIIANAASDTPAPLRRHARNTTTPARKTMMALPTTIALNPPQ